ncbi:hypothetical protein [Paenibacillus antibioticophila]|uniref:hypothetical protein n=1 Tax=Paenibacillus antibioticophila TaxID=1274374 RepID=UPI002017AAA2|nr:hypothetical protein [Paenibacillus antibioticophila]
MGGLAVEAILYLLCGNRCSCNRLPRLHCAGEQIIAFPCAILYGNLAKVYSARTMIIIGIFTYIVSCIAAFFISSIWHVFGARGINRLRPGRYPGAEQILFC